MEKHEVRCVIKYLCLKKMSTKEIHADLVETLGDSAPPYSTVARWCKEFKLGRTSTEDEHREGRPTSSLTEENVKKIEDIVLADRRVTIRHLAEVTGISYGSIQSILTSKMNMKKVSARWVPRMLTDEHKKKRVDICCDGCHSRSRLRTGRTPALFSRFSPQRLLFVSSAQGTPQGQEI